MKVGDRVQLHPATDWWMRGARYGEIHRIPKYSGLIHVKLDVGNIVRLLPADILEVVCTVV